MHDDSVKLSNAQQIAGMRDTLSEMTREELSFASEWFQYKMQSLAPIDDGERKLAKRMSDAIIARLVANDGHIDVLDGATGALSQVTQEQLDALADSN